MAVDLGECELYMIYVYWLEIKYIEIINMCSWWIIMIKNKIKLCL